MMTAIMQPRPAATGRVVLLAATILSGCGAAGERDVRTWASAEMPACAVAEPGCDPLALPPGDSAMLEVLGSPAEVQRLALERLTGVVWRARSGRDGVLHVRLAGVNPLDEPRAAYVLDVIAVDAARDTVLSVASNGGAAVWLNGQRLGRSRDAERPLRAHQDLYTVPLRAGRNTLLYRVLTTSEDAQLHREWHGVAALPRLLDATILMGAYTGLPVSPRLPDSATTLALKPPQVRLAVPPLVTLRWRTLLGEPLGEGGTYAGPYPERLPLPASFTGMAVLETVVTDPAGGRVLYYEQLPVFADSTALRLARELTGGAPPASAVHSARRAAVRAYFALDPPDSAAVLSPWNQVHALADLYRVVHQPEAFQRYPGPQVWGYHAADGSVQPYRLTVPPAAVAPGSEGGRFLGLVFSLTHMVDSSFWRGRGRSDGWVAHMNTVSAVHGHFGVVPHLGGRQEFAAFGPAELRAIVLQVDSVFGIDTARVAILAWSSHARETVRMAQDPRLPLARVGLAVPALHQDPDSLSRALGAVRGVRPALRWTLWRATEDNRIPRERTEAWVKAIRRARFTIDYHEVEYSTHLGGFYYDVEAELHRQLTVADRAGGGS
jgi:hypothetical protein